MSIESTNTLIDLTIDNLLTLRDWAFADAEGALDDGCKELARDDERRAQKIERAIQLLRECKR